MRTRNNANFSVLTFYDLSLINGPSNGVMGTVCTSDCIQSMESIKQIITTSIYSCYQWKQNNLVRGGCNKGIIILLDTKLLHCTAQQKLLCILQLITVTAGNASHLMNTFTEHNDRISYNVEHDSYQDMHFWHLFLLCISLNGAENFQIYAWKVNSTKHTVKSFPKNNQNLLPCSSDHEKVRIQFPDYARKHSISCGYLSWNFFIRKVRYSSLIEFLTYHRCGYASADIGNYRDDTTYMCISCQQNIFKLRYIENNLCIAVF